ncbi:CHAT domain-containing protein [Microbacterium sp. SSM24]|uniref:CHAT domain-containing protein n=1 Tax=Microbacterium sp. SSM24 TaxID=2991714 RepID=UPI002227B39D|nr:CHAT domain-containing protein [Microbacterium sp. SSM24]MCW3492459.1 CHAT domain-containing protein [Microbacterium sp. SSM24]
MTGSADDLHQQAVDLVNRGRFDAAGEVLDRAAAAAEEANLRARITGTRAYVLARTGHVAEAERICREALAGGGLTDHTVAILAGQLGALATEAGRLDDAERWLTRAIEALADDPVAEANTRVNRSLVRMRHRRLEDAEDDLGRAAEMFAAAGMPVAEAQARHNLGYVAMLSGDLVGALQAMVSAAANVGDTAVGAAVGDLDRAEVLRDAGLTTEAEAILGRVAVTFGELDMPSDSAQAELNLARSLLHHAPDRAAVAAGAAADRFRALGNDAWLVRAEGVRLRALLRADAAADPPSTDEVSDAAAALDRHRFRNEAAALRLALELWLADHGEPAVRRIRPSASASIDVRLLAHEARAARARAARRPALVRRHAASGLATLADWQGSFGSLDLQSSVGMHGAGLIYAGLASAVESGDPAVVFEWSERARHLSQQVVPLRPPPDPELAGELSELRLIRADDLSDEWLAQPRAAALRERARERQWSATGGAALERPATLDALQAALPADAAHIAYVYSRAELVALVVTSETAEVVRLPGWDRDRSPAGLRADLDMAASVRSGPMAPIVRRSLDARLAELSAALLDAPIARAGRRRIVITAPGVLSGIPWAMLPGMRSHPFALAVSASRWMRMRVRRGGTFAHATAGFAVGPRVARGREEVEAAASVWAGASTLDVGEASVDRVTALASSVDVLHVAAHGRHAVDNPFFSGLELADGTLFGYDIDLMRQVPDTVVLSACEVGRSSVRWGEEAIGMARIWLHAGTRSVVAAPVIVADDVACELLGAMHEGLALGVAPSEALADAVERTGIVAPFQVHGAGF